MALMSLKNLVYNKLTRQNITCCINAILVSVVLTYCYQLDYYCYCYDYYYYYCYYYHYYYYSVNKPSIKLHMCVYNEIQAVMVHSHRKEEP